MSATTEFYLARAEECARGAAEAGLANVRERCLRSEAAWRTLAGRVIRAEERKQDNLRDKAAAA